MTMRRRSGGRHGGAIEASSILEHDGKFYLLVSFDQCCKGVSSTYNIRVGRADRVEGPYLDRDGKDMLEGGGSLVLATTGRFIGPGGQEAVKTSKGEMLAYHYYDGADGGASKLQFSPLRWSPDGWPELSRFRLANQRIGFLRFATCGDSRGVWHGGKVSGYGER